MNDFPALISLLTLALALAATGFIRGRIDRVAVLQGAIRLQAPRKHRAPRGRRAHRAAGRPTGPFTLPLVMVRASVA